MLMLEGDKDNKESISHWSSMCCPWNIKNTSLQLQFSASAFEEFQASLNVCEVCIAIFRLKLQTVLLHSYSLTKRSTVILILDFANYYYVRFGKIKSNIVYKMKSERQKNYRTGKWLMPIEGKWILFQVYFASLCHVSVM